MVNVHRLGMLVLVVACAPARVQDPLAKLVAGLEPKLAPFVAKRDSMLPLLRRDSGTVRADSSLLQFRVALGASIAAAVKSFDDSVLQIAIAPDGADAQRAARTRVERDTPVDSAERAASDSIIRFLDSRGVRANRAEGTVYYDASDAALLRTFGRFLTPPTQAFLRLVAEEQGRPSAADASLMIGWDGLAERLAKADRLLAAHPGAPGAPLVRERYRWYLRFYLRGGDNSRIFNRTSRLLQPQVGESYQRYIAMHGTLRSGAIVRAYLDAIRANGNRDGGPVFEYLKRLSDLPNIYLPPIDR